MTTDITTVNSNSKGGETSANVTVSPVGIFKLKWLRVSINSSAVTVVD